jgi:hypothetical protein
VDRVGDPDQICDAVAHSKLFSPGRHPADPLPRLGLSAHRGRGFDRYDAGREPVSKADGEPTDTGTDVHDEALRSHKRFERPPPLGGGFRKELATPPVDPRHVPLIAEPAAVANTALPHDNKYRRSSPTPPVLVSSNSTPGPSRR